MEIGSNNKYSFTYIKEFLIQYKYLDLSLGRKNVLMMFNKEYQYNAIIFDNRDNTIIVSGQRQGLIKINYS